MKDFVKKIQDQFNRMCKTGKLFRANISGQAIWDIYLESFEKEFNPKFRDPASTVHNCNNCNNFIRRYGNIVAINQNTGEVMSIFDVVDVPEEYSNVVIQLVAAIHSSTIVDVFFESHQELNSLPYETIKGSPKHYQLGVHKNIKRYTKAEAELYGVVEPDEIREFHHMFLKVPNTFVDATGKSIESVVAHYRDKYQVFKRCMKEIPLDTLQLVRDLIKQGSLLDGDTHLHAVEDIIKFKELYNEVGPNSSLIDNWFWNESYVMEERTAKFKNTLVGVLCTELAEGEEINKACLNWNKRVDPANYMKAVAPITESQKKNAQEFVEENNYVESFNRRFATIDDIKVNEILHSNVGNGEIKSVSIFDDVKTSNSRHKRNEFKGVEEVSIEKFMKDILPGCTSVEVYLENKLENNFVTLTTSNDEDAKQIFKWTNPYSWTYKGNLAGKSMIKEAVKSQGGKVSGILRFSIMWAEEGTDNSDLDAWCQEPNKNQIGFSRKAGHLSKGNLDVDIRRPISYGFKNVVENITYPQLNSMQEGTYKFWVHQYAARGSKGFRAEIEFDGQLFEYSYNQPVSGNVVVAKVTLKDGQFSIEHKLSSSSSSKELYGLETQQFHKVNLMCLSPNHWGDNNIGNKHYFFMLDKCKTDSVIRSFHSENLEPQLAEHRKVLEVLGAVNMLEPTDNQLSGIGFNATVKDEVILKLKGSHKRVVKVQF